MCRRLVVMPMASSGITDNEGSRTIGKVNREEEGEAHSKETKSHSRREIEKFGWWGDWTRTNVKFGLKIRKR